VKRRYCQIVEKTASTSSKSEYISVASVCKLNATLKEGLPKCADNFKMKKQRPNWRKKKTNKQREETK